jgi:hypothetical protein
MVCFKWDRGYVGHVGMWEIICEVFRIWNVKYVIV